MTNVGAYSEQEVMSIQTFLPYADLQRSAVALDRRRLGKQRVEVAQILSALGGRTEGWLRAPATRMWRGYEPALILYGVHVCVHWRSLGYVDHMLDRITDYQSQFGRADDDAALPPWFGDERFHTSHQSNLVRKFPEYYRLLFPDVPDDLAYVWPA